MYYIKSTTQKTYSVLGKIIPACVTANNEYLQVDSEFVTKMKSMPVIKSLIKSGGIFITDEEPAELKNSLEGLTTSNAALMARNTELQEQIKALNSKLTADVNSAEALEAAHKETEDLKAEAVKELQEKQDALDAANAEIEKLKKKLAKASKDAE